MKTRKTILTNLLLLAIFSAAGWIAMNIITEEDILGLGVIPFFLLKAVDILAIWGLYELGKKCFYKGWLPTWFNEKMSENGYYQDGHDTQEEKEETL